MEVTERQLFAAAALVGIIAWTEAHEIGGGDQERLFSEIAFDFADAMILEEKSRGHHKGRRKKANATTQENPNGK